jgi:hypothetical protein
MHNNVNVNELEFEKETQKEQSADVDFWEKVAHRKGNKKGGENA